MRKLLYLLPFALVSILHADYDRMSDRVFVRQQVLGSAINSSTNNLNAGQTFTGSSHTTLGVNAVQVSLKTDQNCIIYVDQSPDGDNWDIVDEYNYYSSINNFGITVQCINSYFRVRVKNTGTRRTTHFRLQSVLCPVVEAVPRSLDEDGHFNTAVNRIRDQYDFGVENTPMGEMRTVVPTQLVGKTFEGSVIDNNFFISSCSVLGSSTSQNEGTLILQTSSASTSFSKVYSSRRARYTAGQSMAFRSQVLLSSAVENNVRKWGVAFGASTPTITDGAYFELRGTTLGCVVLKGSVEYRTQSGSFNGKLGDVLFATNTLQTYEIYWTNKRIYFVYNDQPLHTVTASTQTNMNTVHHRIYFENSNYGISPSTTNLTCFVASIRRLGQLLTQPISYYQAGQVAELVLKRGLGNLHEIVISGVANTSVVTLYDNTSASGQIIWSSGAMGAQTTPFALDFKGLPFFNGLTLAITAANSNAMVVYE